MFHEKGKTQRKKIITLLNNHKIICIIHRNYIKRNNNMMNIKN